MILPFALLVAGATAAADPVSAEKALENYRNAFPPAAPPACGSGDEPDEIVVCGKRDGDRYRLPLPSAPMPGQRTRMTGTSGMDHLDKGNDPCTAVGRQQSCGHIDFISIVAAVAQAAVKAARDE